MSELQRYIPLAEPLRFSHPAHRDCRACVIVPARNEEAQLARTLDALRVQQDLRGTLLNADSYEVLLLLNNCTDGSERIAEAYAQHHPAFPLRIAARTLTPDQAHVGTARRLLMDAAYQRLHGQEAPHCAILSTDADSVVAPEWIARNLLAIEQGAEAVGGAIHLLPAEYDALAATEPAVFRSYCLDRSYQERVARLESLLDPASFDPWPRHLQHFGASLACTPAVYALAGGLPPVKPLEDVAFIDALRKVDARLRHCPETRIYTSARMDGRAEVGLSGQLRHWKLDELLGRPQMVDSAAWLRHRFGVMELLRRFHEARSPRLSGFPAAWHEVLLRLHEEGSTSARFLELLDCNRLIDEMFHALDASRFSPIETAIRDLDQVLDQMLDQKSTQALDGPPAAQDAAVLAAVS